ncbi:2OG-Fe(II) oxygenase [Mycena filopes]|nr:2OG-Fe(II) oxygenase [Mycena filopes]
MTSIDDYAEIPIIDLSSDSDTVIGEVQRACETAGLFYVTNHGIPEAVLDHCLAASADFFSLSDETKLELRQDDPVASNIGYRPPQPDPHGPADLMETFTLQWEEPDEGETPNAANTWPVDVPAFREAALRYYAHADELGTLLLRLIALAMGLEEDFFLDVAESNESNSSRMRLEKYPPQSREVIAAGSHLDPGLFTILLQQPGIEALQVAIPKTGWTFIPPIPGTLVVILGEQSPLITNRVFRSPLQRVVSRPGPERHCVPFFIFADSEVLSQPS